jgi:hypothetical protein
MSLPFSERDFLTVFAAYNETLWPAVLISWGLAVVLLVGLARGSARPGWVLTLAAFLWGWSGIAYHAAFFTAINPAAWIFAMLFVVEAAGLASLVVSRWPVTFALGHTLRGKIAAGLLVYAVLYPILVWLSGTEFPRAPVFAVPCPTVLFTAGILLAATPAVPRWLYVAPVLWAIIGGSAAFLLGVTPDLMLLAAAVALVLDGLAAARPARAASVV